MVETQPESARELAPGKPERGATNRYSFVEGWLDDHLNAVALAVIAAGFIVRVSVASRSYLNPDEGLHYLLLNQPSVLLAYKAGLSNAHPPLMYLVVYFWHFLGRSELMLRLPSVFAGTAFCWFIFKWIGIVFGRTASLMGLIFATFSPAMIALSAELRQYALLLFCMAAALYFLERAFQEESAGGMCYFSVFLYLAILSHYSAVFFTLAIGLYSVARITDSHLPRKVVAAWAGGQVGALAIYGFLYFSHILKIKNYIAVWGMPFDGAYFHLDREGIGTFTIKHTLKIFEFMFENQYTAEALLLLWVVAVAFLLVRDLTSHGGGHRGRHLGILLLLPFVAVWGAAIAGFYPYVGDRHTVFLAPFAMAAVSFLLAAVFGQRLWAALLIAVLLVGASNTSGKTFEPYITKKNQSQALMTAAAHYIQLSIPRSGLILTDQQSSFAIPYYLCGPRVMISVDVYSRKYFEFRCNGYSIVSFHSWKVLATSFPSEFEKMALAHGLKSGDRVWFFQNGWGETLDRELPRQFPQFRCLTAKNFGRNIAVIPFVVGPNLLPAAPETNCPPAAFNSVIE